MVYGKKSKPGSQIINGSITCLETESSTVFTAMSWILHCTKGYNVLRFLPVEKRTFAVSKASSTDDSLGSEAASAINPVQVSSPLHSIRPPRSRIHLLRQHQWDI